MFHKNKKTKRMNENAGLHTSIVKKSVDVCRRALKESWF